MSEAPGWVPDPIGTLGYDVEGFVPFAIGAGLVIDEDGSLWAVSDSSCGGNNPGPVFHDTDALRDALDEAEAMIDE